MEKNLNPIRVTYTHPIFGKTVTDEILSIDHQKESLTVDRCRAQSVEPLKIHFFEVISWEFADPS